MDWVRVELQAKNHLWIAKIQALLSSTDTTIYNQYLIRYYLQKIFKMTSSKAWVWQIKNLQNLGGGVQRSESKFRTPI